MEERLGYPAAPRWSISAENRNFAATVFDAILIRNGFEVLIDRDLAEKRKRLRRDGFAGRGIVWREREHSRSLLLRWQKRDAIALIDQNADGTVAVAVASADSAEITQRHIEVAEWNEIATNYAGETRRRLAGLMEGFRPAKGKGRLLLWHGEPGTGKTFAIRALAWAWRDWCRFEYVVDPDRLFGSATYLIEVALERPAGHFLFEDKWNGEKRRLLVIEDSGELMAVDERSQVGQGLSRLLSLTDGILGQGTNILILVTTNEELGNLNPAVRRPGRCLSEIEFRRFNRDEATAWLRGAGSETRAGQALTLSELYALRDGQKPVSGPKRIGFRLGEVLLDGSRAGA